jgi:serine/threonine protein kinase
MTGRRLIVNGVPYKIAEKIGFGVHSQVYGGYDLRDGRSVAIKIIDFIDGTFDITSETESRQESFWKEIEMLLYLQPLNPYIIRILNHEYTDQHGIIIMERGETFRDSLIKHVATRTPISPFFLHRFWSQMVESIYYMHKIGIVHGDCKPENFIQLGLDGTVLRLIDMGISFQLPPNVTSRLKTAAGTPGKLKVMKIFDLFFCS